MGRPRHITTRNDQHPAYPSVLQLPDKHNIGFCRWKQKGQGGGQKIATVSRMSNGYWKRFRRSAAQQEASPLYGEISAE